MLEAMEDREDYFVDNVTTKSITKLLETGSDGKDGIKKELGTLIVPVHVISYFIIFVCRCC